MMNPLKIRYAMDRVNALENARLKALQADNTVKGKTATPEQQFAALKAGRLPFRKDVCSNGFSTYTDVRYIYDFDSLNTDDKFNQTAYDRSSKPIIKAANKARDYIMLGDEVNALKMIQEFEQDT